MKFSTLFLPALALLIADTTAAQNTAAQNNCQAAAAGEVKTTAATERIRKGGSAAG